MSNPSLLCVPYRFKTSKLYSQIPDSGLGDFTVTRSASNAATRVNAAGLIETVADNVPRLDYPLGGITAGCPALLVEPSAQNLLQRSEEFNDAYWSKSFGTVTQDQTTAPNGLTTADKYVVNNGQPLNSPIIRSFTFAINTAYTLSLFVKKADYNTASIRLNTTETGLVTNSFNLATGTATNNQIQNYGNGWYRVWVSFTTAATVTNGQVQLIRDAEVRDGVAGIFIWGAQLEVGSVPTSYIPTTTAAITRGAEVVSKTGISSLIGQTEGTIYLETNKLMDATLERFLSIYSSTSPTNDNISISKTTSNTINFAIRKNNVLSTYAANFSGTVFKFACAFNTASGGVAIYVNGTQLLIDTNSGSFASVLNEVYIGRLRPSINTDNLYNGRIRAAAIYPTRLTNAQLQSLTQ